MWHSGKTSTALAATLLSLGMSIANAALPDPQPRPLPSQQILSADGKTTVVTTPEGQFSASDPFKNPPGTNHLENVYENMRDHFGNEMPNTLPSTPDVPYNLHPDPIVVEIDKTSPTDDLVSAFNKIKKTAKKKGKVDLAAVQLAVDILEGNPVAGRVYSGFPLLHYNGPDKSKVVNAICEENNPCQPGDTVIGGNVVVNQLWYDSHIESDTGCINPLAVWDVPWTITYNVNVLNRGHEDFAPFVAYFDHPDTPVPVPGLRLPHVAMDQTFFPMEDGTRTTYQMSMTKGMYYNLTYHWGWRMHPPRVQVQENCLKRPAGISIPQWEINVFGETPTASEEDKLAAINMIGDLSPAKRMWSGLRAIRALVDDDDDKDDDDEKERHGKDKDDDDDEKEHHGKNKKHILKLLKRVKRAFFQWGDRTALPDGVELDTQSDVTLFYVNNTIYGRMTNLAPGKDNQAELPEWGIRPYLLKVKIYNGDYFQHAYTAADFGGSRGWENTFQSSLDIGGAGPLFTFGRAHWWMPAGAPIARDADNKIVPGMIKIAASTRSEKGGALTKKYKLKEDVTLGEHDVHITYNHEPSRRIKVYQFDPTHHDTAIWSMH